MSLAGNLISMENYILILLHFEMSIQPNSLVVLQRYQALFQWIYISITYEISKKKKRKQFESWQKACTLCQATNSIHFRSPKQIPNILQPSSARSDCECITITNIRFSRKMIKATISVVHCLHYPYHKKCSIIKLRINNGKLNRK